MPLELHVRYIDRVFRTNADGLDFASKNTLVLQECGDIEQDSLECLEAYGSRRGHKLCKNFLDDYNECVNHFFQQERVNQMRRERMKQVLRGERKPFELFDKIKPPKDSFQFGPFYN